MNFNQQVKKDLCAMPMTDEGSLRGELAGLLMSGGVVVFDQTCAATGLEFTTDHLSVAGRVVKIAKALYALVPKVSTRKQKQFKDKRVAKITFDRKVPEILKDLRLAKIVKLDERDKRMIKAYATGLGADDGNTYPEDSVPFVTVPLNDSHINTRIPPYYHSKQRYLTAFLRGVFMACGNVSDPDKGYRVELCCKDKILLESAADVLTHYDIKTYFTTRKSVPILLFKEAESVVNFFGLIGANKTVFRLEDIRMMKEMRNDANRRTNADIANINKTSEASAKQRAAIDKIEENGGFDDLPAGLKELALLRRKYPDESLISLGAMMDPPLGKTTVYRRLNKLIKIAEGQE